MHMRPAAARPGKARAVEIGFDTESHKVHTEFHKGIICMTALVRSAVIKISVELCVHLV